MLKAHRLPGDKPGWARAAAVQPALRLGAQLESLHQALAISPITGLLADRAGLLAAAKLLARAGRPESLADLRDLRLMGDPAGPAAPSLSAWTWLSGLPWEEDAATRFRPRRDEEEDTAPADRRHHSSLQALARQLGLQDAGAADDLAAAAGAAAALPCPLAAAGAIIDAGTGMPLTVQLLATDYAVGRCLGWPLPIYSLGLSRRELPDPSPHAAARVLLAGTSELATLLRPLSTRAAELVATTRSIRTIQRDQVLTRIFSQDMVWPAGLVDLLPLRHSRRLLQRLVELGPLRELSGRPSYRIYGL